MPWPCLDMKQGVNRCYRAIRGQAQWWRVNHLWCIAWPPNDCAEGSGWKVSLFETLITSLVAMHDRNNYSETSKNTNVYSECHKHPHTSNHSICCLYNIEDGAIKRLPLWYITSNLQYWNRTRLFILKVKQSEWGILHEGRFLMTWPVMVSWESSEVVCPPQVSGWGSANLSHLLICHPRGVILTLNIHWLGPQLFLPWCSKATLAIRAHTSKTLLQ